VIYDINGLNFRDIKVTGSKLFNQTKYRVSCKSAQFDQFEWKFCEPLTSRLSRGSPSWTAESQQKFMADMDGALGPIQTSKKAMEKPWKTEFLGT